MRKKNTETGLSLSNFSQQHSWIFYVRGVREIAGRAASSENDMIFWEVVEGSTASPEKVISVGPCGTIAVAHWEGFSSATTAWSGVLQRQMGVHSNSSAHLLGGNHTHRLQQTCRLPWRVRLGAETAMLLHRDILPCLSDACFCLPFGLGHHFPFSFILLWGGGLELGNETPWCTSTFEKEPPKLRWYAIARS